MTLSRVMINEIALLAANAAYYAAFAARDSEAMAAVWAEDDVSCVHPGWPALIGRNAVLQSYRDIFRNPMQEPLEQHGANVLPGADEGRVFCVESVGAAALLATNWFRLIEGQWRLVHHQASPLAVSAPEPRDRTSMH